MNNTKSQWYIELKCDCPHCNEWIDLLDYADFWEHHRIEAGEHNTYKTKDMEVICPECGNEFQTDLVL